LEPTIGTEVQPARRLALWPFCLGLGSFIAALLVTLTSVLLPPPHLRSLLQILFLSTIAAVLAIVLGIHVRKRTKVGTPGRGLATAGLVLGIVWLVIVLLAIGLFLLYVTSPPMVQMTLVLGIVIFPPGAAKTIWKF